MHNLCVIFSIDRQTMTASQTNKRRPFHNLPCLAELNNLYGGHQKNSRGLHVKSVTIYTLLNMLDRCLFLATSLSINTTECERVFLQVSRLDHSVGLSVCLESVLWQNG